jgi:uncharacterized protein (TIGR03083 family)
VTLVDALEEERLVLADLLEGLTPEQWRAQTLCAAWDVHQMAAHLVAPVDGSTGLLLRLTVRSRFSPDRLGLLVTDHFAGLGDAELVARLRAHARTDFAPPLVGLLGPYTDALVHGEDIRVPLGIGDDRPPQRWAPSLDFLLSRRARLGFRPAAAPRLTYAATDLAWSHGSGPRVEGPAAALALALTCRTARLDELAGPGARILDAWARSA